MKHWFGSPAAGRDSESLVRLQMEVAIMLNWALGFLVLAIIAAVLGAGGVAGLSMNIAYALFVIFIILLVISFITGRKVV